MEIEEKLEFLKNVHLDKDTIASLKLVETEHDKLKKIFIYSNDLNTEELRISVVFYGDLFFRINFFFYKLVDGEWVVGKKAHAYFDTEDRREILEAGDCLVSSIKDQLLDPKFRLFSLNYEVKIVNLIEF